MPQQPADGLVVFRRVRVIGTTALALFCAIGERQVWLPRIHVKGRLWSRGDRGTLLVRRWVAVDRHLIAADEPGEPLPVAVPPGRARPKWRRRGLTLAARLVPVV